EQQRNHAWHHEEPREGEGVGHRENAVFEPSYFVGSLHHSIGCSLPWSSQSAMSICCNSFVGRNTLECCLLCNSNRTDFVLYQLARDGGHAFVDTANFE